jgi:predicted RNA binding protein YcfA (HicA-like mRNA interferase family)
MATRGKRVEAMRRNPRHVRFDVARRALEAHGFEAETTDSSHWVFRHPGLRLRVVLVYRRPFILPIYVAKALEAIDRVLIGDEGGASHGSPTD